MKYDNLPQEPIHHESYDLGYEQGKADERLKILGLVNFKYSDDERIRIRHIDISYDSLLSPEQVVCIILEQLKEQRND